MIKRARPSSAPQANSKSRHTARPAFNNLEPTSWIYPRAPFPGADLGAYYYWVASVCFPAGC